MGCKYCDSLNIIKYGKSQGKQCYLCKDCNHKFVDNGNYPKMRLENRIIVIALDLYFEGLSTRKVQRQISNIFGVDVDQKTIWLWIQKYSKLVKAYVDTLKAENLSGEWCADETSIKSKGDKDPWYWEVLDRETRYLVASHLSKGRTEGDAIVLFKQAKKRSKDKPHNINVDGLGAYRRGYSKNFWTRKKEGRPKLTQRVGLRGVRNNNPVERLHGTLKDRTKPMRALGSSRRGSKYKIETVEYVLKGWDVHYNFIRPHSSLKGKTPAEVAGVNIELNDGWGDLIQLATIHKTRDEMVVSIT